MNELPVAIDTFILQWGDMGARWGVNRSVAQIHAYLYLAEEPVTAEDVTEALGMARSNVSNSLKELLAWKLVHRVPVRGDRREHFAAETDVWEIAAKIAEGRKLRELDPAITALEDSVAHAAGDGDVSKIQRDRLKAMLDFTRTADRFYAQMLGLSTPKRKALLKMGAKISNLLPAAKD
ncbi:GbsR/MarR family transcriptional regulator [Ahrensia sp. R2A130]|uniref:GbsR/MarR family transcriptional regulator n=1 Tax=Ahrensia sp. R2A130 TaxID=744979 RepID=UPI0001E0B4CC|nr:MarR family transcriptional regulator [Ahrensia sp. R2A130]EFL88710.1 transcriptional regulatory protein [Ahrensia sp. R2A130]